MRLLKFDTINPDKYIEKKIGEASSEILRMSRTEMLNWIISLRGNFSDFYTHNLENLGWQAEEFILTPKYIEKTASELYGSSENMKKLRSDLIDYIRPLKDRWKRSVMLDYIDSYKPDVILVREQCGVPSDFWRHFRQTSLIVSRIATPVPRNWSVTDHDVFLTSTEVYRKFFELNGFPSYIVSNGFDERVIGELRDEGKIYNTTFVGGLGDRFWGKRTKCFRYLSERTDIKWWGYNEEIFGNDDMIRQAHQGLASGLEMLQIYKDSKIVFNDYGEIADGMGVNQRIFEVLGTGSFLLTRNADNLREIFPEGCFAVFNDEKDCLDKITYYLKNDKEREEIAARGQKFLLENYNYKDIMKDLDKILRENYRRKFRKELK